MVDLVEIENMRTHVRAHAQHDRVIDEVERAQIDQHVPRLTCWHLRYLNHSQQLLYTPRDQNLYSKKQESHLQVRLRSSVRAQFEFELQVQETAVFVPLDQLIQPDYEYKKSVHLLIIHDVSQR